MNKYEWMYNRARNNDGHLRTKRSDAKIDNKIKEKLDCRKDKTVGGLLKDLNVGSISEARRKLKLS
jgi:hypothetical protein